MSPTNQPWADFIPPNYHAGREQFRAAVRARNIPITSFPMPGGDDLTVDVARFGPADAEGLVIASSGLHGGEGPFGAGVQLATLAGRWPERVGMLFIHALNPFGYANCRRTDADNVDLNRNFLAPGTPYRGSPPNFDVVDGVVNPRRPPRWWDPFLVRMWWLRRRLGDRDLRQAVAGGQHENPQGLFYGGVGPSPLYRLLDRELPAWIGQARRVIHLDFHTGLGPFGTHKLLITHEAGSPRYERWKRRFGDAVESCGGPTSYANSGGLDEWVEVRFPAIECDAVCAEFGTYPTFRALTTLRDENLAWFFTPPGSVTRQRAAAQMRETFVPADLAWRQRTVKDGMELLLRAAEVLAN